MLPGSAVGADTSKVDMSVFPNLDIYRSANVLIREHGQGATIEAAKHADAMLAKGDLEGQAVWKRIVKAVGELQRREWRSGETAH